MPITPYQRLLHLRVLALQNVSTAWIPHVEMIEMLADVPITKLKVREREINRLAWRYRRQIGAELVPVIVANSFQSGAQPRRITSFDPLHAPALIVQVQATI